MPPLGLAKKLPRIGVTDDSGATLNLVTDEPMHVGDTTVDPLTSRQERLASRFNVPTRTAERTTVPCCLGSTDILNVELHFPQGSGVLYPKKEADVAPVDNRTQGRGLCRIERVGAMLAGVFVDRPVKGSEETIERELQYTAYGDTDRGLFLEAKHVDTTYKRRGFEVGVGIPRLLDRRRQLPGGFRGLSNRGIMALLGVTSAVALATPQVDMPEGAEEPIEDVIEGVSGGWVGAGDITGAIPDVSIPIPWINNIDVKPQPKKLVPRGQTIERSDPTITRTTVIEPGSQPKRSVRVTEFGLGNFQGEVGEHDLAAIDEAVSELGDDKITLVRITGSASDESQQNLASETCGIGVKDVKNDVLAQQRVDTVAGRLAENGVNVAKITFSDIGETVIEGKAEEIAGIVARHPGLTIQSVCEQYNAGDVDALPADVRIFFDEYLSDNRFVEVDFFTGEYVEASEVTSDGECVIEETIETTVDELSEIPDVDVDFEWKHLDIDGRSFGFPTAVVVGGMLVLFGQAGRRERTVMRRQTQVRDVVFDEEKQNFVAYVEPEAPMPVKPEGLPSGCAVPRARYLLLAALLAVGTTLAFRSCGEESDPAPNVTEPTPQVDTQPCNVETTRIVTRRTDGTALSRVTSTSAESVPTSAIVADEVTIIGE